MLRVCTRCQLVSRDLMQSPAVACREIEPPSSSAVRAAEKPFSPCRHWSTGRANSASRASSSPSTMAVFPTPARPIQPDELSVFAGAATHSEHVGAVHDYVSDLLIKGSM